MYFSFFAVKTYTKYKILVTPKEIKQWYRGFMQDCPSGKLTQAKFSDVYGRFFPNGNADAFATFVFNLFDEDGNGDIEFSEFLMAISVTSRGTVEDKLECTYIYGG